MTGDHRGNELFPSAAWRYLLPDPSPSTVAAVGDGSLSATARLLGRAPSGDDAGGADLAVADRADRATLDRLHGQVRPGGTVFLEVPWPRYRPAGLLARRLTEAGFGDPMLYSLSPSDHRWSPSWWVPVGQMDCLRFVAGLGPLAPGPGGSGLDRLRAWTTRALLAVPMLASNHPWLIRPTRRQLLCAVATRPSDDGTPGPSCEPGLLPISSGPFIGRGTAAMRVGGSSTDQAMMFGFGDGDRPDVVVKAPIRSEELAATGHEAEVLALLTGRPDPLPGVPRVVALPSFAGVAAWGQTFARGAALATVVDPTNMHRFARAMTRWLVDLAEQTNGSGGDGPADHSAVDDLEPLWRQLPDGATLRERTEAVVRGRTGSMTVCQHRDLGPWNVMVDGGTIRVIDWADADLRGRPLCDLHHFLAHLVLCAYDAYEQTKRQEVVAQLADAGSEVGGLVDGCLATYASAVGLDAGQVQALRVSTWLLDLLRRPVSEQVRSVYLDLLRAELG